jgi:acylphosphatase
MTRLHAVVRETVQGVFFRQFTLECATALGVTGWVRNCADGAVEVVAEGERGALEALRGALAEGPPLARVASVDDTWEVGSGEFVDFQVRG